MDGINYKCRTIINIHKTSKYFCIFQPVISYKIQIKHYFIINTLTLQNKLTTITQIELCYNQIFKEN